MISTLLFHLGVFHGPHRVHHEFLHDPIDTVGVLAFHIFVFLSTLLFQVCQMQGGYFKCQVGPLKLLQGEETSHLGFGSVISCLALGSMESSFSASLVAHR